MKLPCNAWSPLKYEPFTQSFSSSSSTSPFRLAHRNFPFSFVLFPRSFLLVLLFQEVCSFSSFPFVSFNCLFACFQQSYLAFFKCTFGSSSSAFDKSLNNKHSINAQNSKKKEHTHNTKRYRGKKWNYHLSKRYFRMFDLLCHSSYCLNWDFFFAQFHSKEIIIFSRFVRLFLSLIVKSMAIVRSFHRNGDSIVKIANDNKQPVEAKKKDDGKKTTEKLFKAEGIFDCIDMYARTTK